jgi:hypothetical protein
LNGGRCIAIRAVASGGKQADGTHRTYTPLETYFVGVLTADGIGNVVAEGIKNRPYIAAAVGGIGVVASAIAFAQGADAIDVGSR